MSARGIAVRSKSEVIIADALTDAGLHFEYEQPFVGSDGATRYPDFTIADAETGTLYLWEHCGMLADPDYRARWERKKEWYRRQGVLPEQEGGGSMGTLLLSEDSPRGGINSHDIREMIRRLFV